MLGTRLWYPFWEADRDDSPSFERRLDAVVREIGQRGLRQPATHASIAGTAPTPVPANSPSLTGTASPYRVDRQPPTPAASSSAVPTPHDDAVDKTFTPSVRDLSPIVDHRGSTDGLQRRRRPPPPQQQQLGSTVCEGAADTVMLSPPPAPVRLSEAFYLRLEQDHRAERQREAAAERAAAERGAAAERAERAEVRTTAMVVALSASAVAVAGCACAVTAALLLLTRKRDHGSEGAR
eukprot:COSAG01_NODE_17673_length_1132_cov_1.789932_1_plen_237_part_00